MNECIFCKIVARDLPAEILYETEQVIAFRDLNPVAPQHILIIPTRHIASTNDLEEEDAVVVGDMHLAAAEIAKREGFDKSGFRTVMNCGLDGGQTVFHMHLHLLGGRTMSWPPG